MAEMKGDIKGHNSTQVLLLFMLLCLIHIYIILSFGLKLTRKVLPTLLPFRLL
jgi:hypothetical protein